MQLQNVPKWLVEGDGLATATVQYIHLVRYRHLYISLISIGNLLNITKYENNIHEAKYKSLIATTKTVSSDLLLEVEVNYSSPRFLNKKLEPNMATKKELLDNLVVPDELILVFLAGLPLHHLKICDYNEKYNNMLQYYTIDQR